MCGIAGIVDYRGLDRGSTEQRLQAATQRMAARGPDGKGLWSSPLAAFAHRRLAVIALGKDGAQPMHGHGLTITFNGEIFNYQAIRSELERVGVRFETTSDTEVLLAGWAQWREGLLARLVGMFAFALWDSKVEELILVRDRFGEKPLFYKVDGTTCAFASEFIALESVLGSRLPLNLEALSWLFALRYIPDPLSIGQGAFKLEPGTLARFSRSGFRVSRWYNVEAGRMDVPSDWRETAALVRQAVDAAVKDRLISDVPIGAFLSGGIDSAIIAASIAATGTPVRSFTVGFEGASPYYEERPAARAMADHIGADHTEITVPSNFSPDILDDVVTGMDEPFGDSSALAQFIVSRETRRCVTVALSGDGADEAFGGYRKYQGERLARLYSRVPSYLRRCVIEPLIDRLPEDKDSRLLERFRRLRRFVRHAGKPADARQAGWNQDIDDAELSEIFFYPVGSNMVRNRIRALHHRFSGFDPLTRHLLTDVSLGLPGDMLVKVDRMSMVNSLEVRSPFLDQRVVELAASISGNGKVAFGRGKWILRQSFRDRLPAQLLRLPKRGFEIPVASLLRGRLADTLRIATDRGRLERQGLFQHRPIDRWLTALNAQHTDPSSKLWTLLVFQRWAEVHNRPEAA